MSLFYARKLLNLVKADEEKKEEVVENSMENGQALHSGPIHTTKRTSLTGNEKLVDNPHPHKERRGIIANAPVEMDDDDDESLPTFEKSDKSRSFLSRCLSTHFLFEHLGREDMEKVVSAMHSMEANEGDKVINQGDVGELFYVLEEGMCECFVNGQMVCDYSKGGCFGELALIYGDKRAATIQVSSKTAVLWTLDFTTFRRILTTTNSSRMAAKCEFLKGVPLLKPLTNSQITKIASAMKEASFESGEYIIHQGDIGEEFYLIKEGAVRCTQYKGADNREIDLITIGVGEHFGEMALLLDEPRHANCIAEEDVVCYTLERGHFINLFGSLQSLLAERMRIRVLQSVPLLSKLKESILLKLGNRMRVQAFGDGEFIIRQGEEGTRFYIINEGEVRCTRTIEATGEEQELVRLHPQEYFGFLN